MNKLKRWCYATAAVAAIAMVLPAFETAVRADDPVAWYASSTVTNYPVGSGYPVVTRNNNSPATSARVFFSPTGGTIATKGGSLSNFGPAYPNQTTVIYPRYCWDCPGLPGQPGATMYIRTFGMYRGTTTTYMLSYIGDGYPTTTGYRPAMWTSDQPGTAPPPEGDGYWTYWGKPYIDGQYNPYVMSAGRALIVQEGIPEGQLDTAVASNNRYLAWSDSYCWPKIGGGQVCPGITMFYSANKTDWYTQKDPVTGDVADVLPADLAGDSGLWVMVAHGTAGWHMFFTSKFHPGYNDVYIRHTFSCDGMKWKTLETDVTALFHNGVNVKGPTIYHETTTDRIYALMEDETPQTWRYTRGQQSYSCP